MATPDRRLLVAANLADWHDASVRALGWRPRRTQTWWTCPTPAPNIYHSAILLRPVGPGAGAPSALAEMAAHLDDPDSRAVSVCDPWDSLDLHPVGLTRRATGTSSYRAAPDRGSGTGGDGASDPRPGPRPAGPGTRPPDPARDLVITTVTSASDLERFEAAVIDGFGARFPIAPFDIHAPGILTDRAMSVLLGEYDGGAVAAAMAYRSSGVVGIYGVTTLAAARGRGFATAMTRAALATAPERAAVLQPTPAAGGIYARLGFTTVGPYAHWV